MATIVNTISNVTHGVTGAPLLNGAITASSSAPVSTIVTDGYTGSTSPALYSIFKMSGITYQVRSVSGTSPNLTLGIIPPITANVADNTALTFGADYTTIALWEDGTDNTTIGTDLRVGEVWAGLTPYSDELVVAGTPGTMSTTAHRMVRAGYGQQYDPITRTGALIRNTSTLSATAMVAIQESFFQWEGVGIQLDLTTETGSKYGMYLSGTTTNVDIHRTFIRWSAQLNSPATLAGGAFRALSSNTFGSFYNNICHGVNVSALQLNIDGVAIEGSSWIIWNSVSRGFRPSTGHNGRGFSLPTGSGQTLKNCIAQDNTDGLDFSFGPGVAPAFTNCISSDVSATFLGGGACIQCSSYETFNYADYDDFRLKYTSQAVDNGTSTTLFTTDFAGTSRIGLWEIGAYTGLVLSDYTPPTEVISQIGSTYADDFVTLATFQTIASWELATRLHLVNLNKRFIGELHSDSTFDLAGTLTNGANFYISGAISDSTRYRELRAAAGHAYDPVAATGVQLRGNSGSNPNMVLWINEDYFRFSGAQVENYGAGSAVKSCITTSGTGIQLDAFVVKSLVGSCGASPAYVAGVYSNSNLSLQITNGIAIGSGINSNGLTYGFLLLAPGDKALVANCVAYNVNNNAGSGGYGFKVIGSSSSLLKNCVASGSRTADFYNTGLDTFMYACISSDSSARGMKAQINKTAASMFNLPSVFDFRLIAGSACLNAGYNLQDIFTNDFASRKRTAPWEVGPYDGIVQDIQGVKTDRLATMRYATCWKIERKDGFAIFATDHNQALTLQGQTYLPTGGFDSSAVRREFGMKADDTEFSGVVTSDLITHEDLRGGRYNLAKVTEYVVDWRYPWAQPQIVASYYIKTVSFDSEVWQASVAGISYLLQQKSGRVYSRQCDATLYDERCKVLKATFSQVGQTVTSVTSKTVFAASALSGANDVYKYGAIIWRSGSNVGIDCEVRGNVSSGGVITLQMQLPYTIQVGDTFDIYQGCAHTQDSCKNKFANLVNFRGYRETPGTDRQIQTPLR